MTEIVKVSGISKFFPVGAGWFHRDQYVRAVDDVSFSIIKGENMGLAGESGCGKTTIGKMTIGLVRPTSGQICFYREDIFSMSSKDLKKRRSKMQIIFQDPFMSLNPRRTIRQILEPAYRLQELGSGNGDSESALNDLLSEVKLDPPESFLGRYPHELSGGQRQRVAIARAIATRPDYVVADEPVTALDMSVRTSILTLMRNLQKRFGLTYLLVSHDLSVLRAVCNTLMVMYLGKIVEKGKVGTLFEKPLHPYAEALLSAVPIADPTRSRARKRITLSGDVPSQIKTPTGCFFHPRCRYRMQKCSELRPHLLEVEKDHFVACHLAG